MSQQISPFNLIPKEILAHIFSFLTPSENVQIIPVCKEWKDVATKVAKIQLIVSREKDLKEKMKPFLPLAGGNFEDYTPKLNEIKQNHETLTIKQVHDRMESLTEKYTVCLAGCFVVDENCPNIPKARKTDLAGKAFAEFHVKTEGVTTWDGKDYYVSMFGMYGEDLWHKITYFPVELFNIKVIGDDRQVVGDKNQGTVCLSLKGRLIEIFLIEGDQDVRDARFCYFGISRDNAPKVQIEREDADSGRIWPQDIYVPRLDSKPTIALAESKPGEETESGEETEIV